MRGLRYYFFFSYILPVRSFSFYFGLVIDFRCTVFYTVIQNKYTSPYLHRRVVINMYRQHFRGIRERKFIKYYASTGTYVRVYISCYLMMGDDDAAATRRSKGHAHFPSTYARTTLYYVSLYSRLFCSKYTRAFH